MDNQNNQIENNPTSNLPGGNNQNHSHQKLFWIGGIVALVILAIIGGIFYFYLSKKTGQESKNVAQNQVNQSQSVQKNIQETNSQKSNQEVKNQNQINQSKAIVGQKSQPPRVSLYGCTYDYYNKFNPDNCFVDRNRFTTTTDIHIHGGYLNKLRVPYIDLFINIFIKPDSIKPAYIQFNTETFSNTQCSLTAKIDINNIGVYNQKIFPLASSQSSYACHGAGDQKHCYYRNNNPDYFQLRAQDKVQIPIGNYVKDGMNRIMIISNPNGCNMHIKSFELLDRNKQLIDISSQFIGLPKELGKLVRRNYYLTFSSDGQHFAYVLKFKGKYFVVLDGQEQKKYDFIDRPSIFSPDSQHLAYAAKLNNKEFVVLDRKEQKKYDIIWNIAFSPDSQHLAYIAKLNGEKFVVLDGREQGIYDYIWKPIFSPDSQHLAYIAISGGKQFVVLDGHELKYYQGKISNLHFTKNYLNYNVVQDNGEVWFASKKVE